MEENPIIMVELRLIEIYKIIEALRVAVNMINTNPLSIDFIVVKNEAGKFKAVHDKLGEKLKDLTKLKRSIKYEG